MNYNFPRIKFCDECDLHTQLKHFASECIEIVERIEHGDMPGITEEVLDMLHSAETWIRIVERHGVDIDAEISKVIEKNRARNYYGEG